MELAVVHDPRHPRIPVEAGRHAAHDAILLVRPPALCGPRKYGLLNQRGRKCWRKQINSVIFPTLTTRKIFLLLTALPVCNLTRLQRISQFIITSNLRSYCYNNTAQYSSLSVQYASQNEEFKNNCI